MELTA